MIGDNWSTDFADYTDFRELLGFIGIVIEVILAESKVSSKLKTKLATNAHRHTRTDEKVVREVRAKRAQLDFEPFEPPRREERKGFFIALATGQICS